jgi:hypothetical protein
VSDSDEQMTEKKPRSWMQRVRPLLIILFVGWVIYSTAMHIMVWYVVRQLSQDQPSLWVVPSPLKDATVAKLSGMNVEKFGYSFQVPWEATVTDHTSKSIAGLSFKGGASVLIFDPAGAVNTAKLSQGTTAQQHSAMNRILGANALRSNYDLMAAEVLATPDDARWWYSRVGLARALILLEGKDIEMNEGTSIHPVALGAVRGFQFGDPDVAPYTVNLKLFDGSDRKYWISINGKYANHAVITQSEINGLIASLRTVQAGSVSRSPGNGL